MARKALVCSIGDPDPFRLRYRQQLADVVRETIVRGEAPRRDRLEAWAGVHGIPEGEQVQFGETALSLLLGRHEYSAARYRVTPGEYSAWRARIASRDEDPLPLGARDR